MNPNDMKYADITIGDVFFHEGLPTEEDRKQIDKMREELLIPSEKLNKEKE